MTSRTLQARAGPPVPAPARRASRALGLVRLGVLLFLTAGVFVLQEDVAPGYVLPLYIVALLVSVVGLAPARLPKAARDRWPLLNIVFDFIVVTATVTFTGGPTSLFTSIFIVVVLECGILLGLRLSFVVSTLASLFMLLQVLLSLRAGAHEVGGFELWYNFLVQTLAYYLTAFMAGYWSQRLRQMQIFQSEILDNMNSGFLITDAAGTITASNAAAVSILELAGSPVGRPVEEVLQGESGGESPAYTALRSGRDYTSYEFTARTAKGSRKLLGLTTSRMFDPRGEISGIIASFTDLTEMDQMRREIMRHDRLAAVGELAAGLAHEIRNPVAVIRGAADELTRHSDDADIQGRLRTMILRESDQLNEIVTGFLDFAREPTLKRERIDISALIRELSEVLEHETNGAAGTRITVKAPRHACEVFGDPSQLKQVFVNLGKNAIEAMEMEGALCILVEGGQDRPVHIRFEDEGPGIDPDKVARIFEPFYTTKPTGVGMGLAVCARILTAHDGTIRATSRAGGGCSMNITLPVAVSEDVSGE